MKTQSKTLPAAVLGLALLPLLLGGCATPSPMAERMRVPSMGTVSTYHRTSSGSLGVYDGKVVWTHAPTTFQGKPMVLFSAPRVGGSVHDPVSFGVVASVLADGRPIMSYDPPIDYDWPLVIGKTWSAEHTVTLHTTGAKIPYRRDYRVEAVENLTVPAGTFKAWKLSWKDSNGETETRWIVPDAGIATLKRHVERPATHPQGAGALDAELQSQEAPAR